MILKIRKKDMSYKWYRWFAWYPVRIDDNRIVWLGWVERRDATDIVPAPSVASPVSYRLTN